MAISRGYADVARAAGDRTQATAFHSGLLILLALYMLGVVVGVVLLRADPHLLGLGFGDATTTLYRRQDIWWFAAGVAGILYLRQRMGQPAPPAISRLMDRYWPSDPRIVIHTVAISMAVLAIAGAGAYWAGHGFGFLANEQAAEFQASIFREGELLARVPANAAEFGGAMTPPGILFDSGPGLWGSGRPLAYAALRAAFSMAGVEPLTNAVMAALSVILLVAVARRLWPDQDHFPLMAAILLATTPQFLAAGMTEGDWSAHLCLNLAWLWLYLRGGLLGHLAAAVVGIAAASLDQIHVHLVFVLPFVVAMLRGRRWRLAALYGIAYSAACLIWFYWYEFALSLPAGVPVDVGDLLGSDNRVAVVTTSGVIARGIGTLAAACVDLLRFVAWQNPVMLPLIYVALRSRRALPPVFRQLAWGCLLSLGFLLLPADSADGWGYLPFHGALGGLVLLGTLGWSALSDNAMASKVPATRALAMLTVAMVLIGVPVRVAQMEAEIGPMAAAGRHLKSLSSDIVLVDLPGISFGSALLRNDPYLRDRPMIMALQRLTPEQVLRLCEQHKVDFVDYYDLTQFGIERIPDDLNGPLDLSGLDRELRAIATSPRCNAN